MDDTDDLRTIKRWFSVGDILSAGAMIIAIGVSYGSMSSRLDNMAQDIEAMQRRDITPGAATQIAAMQAKDVSQDAQIQEIRLQLREQRGEILSSLQRLEERLEQRDR